MRLYPSAVVRAGATVARTYGARGLVLRGLHEGRRSLGLFRDRPRHSPGTEDGGRGARLRVDAARLRASSDRETAMERAERVAGGEYQAYGDAWRPLPRSPGEWSRNPVTGHRYPVDEGWWRTAHLDRRAGDIKDVWEPARFGWAYDLVRGWVVGEDRRFHRGFHEALEGFRAAAPPFMGVHWSCGQEVAVRSLALAYAEANLPHSAREREGLLEDLAAGGERVADALGYALSQRNNHGLSEAAALVVLGDRMHGLHPEAAGWFDRGSRWLERLVREQFAPDGWYVQHSFNYLRVALDACVVAHRCLAARERALEGEALARLRAAVDLLAAVMDPGTGRVPNHGANDGALVHPVSQAGHRDFRPSLGAAAATFGHPLPRGFAAEEEALAWLDLPAPPSRREEPPRLRCGPSGWAAARVGPVSLFFRAGSYTSRPGHMDLLHLDVRAGARDLVVDPGTFRYNAADPLWRNGLASARVHNGPLPDAEEPGIRGPRFLWLAWPEAKLLRAEEAGDGSVLLVGEVPGRCRRTVVATAETIRVRDELLDPDATSVAVRWTLAPGVSDEVVQVEGEREVQVGAEGDVIGWFSPAYGRREPTVAVSARTRGSGADALETTLDVSGVGT